MLTIYLCGAVVMTVAAVMFADRMRGAAFLAGLLWPVVVVGIVQICLIHLLAKVMRTRAASDESRPLTATAPSNPGAAASTRTGTTISVAS